MFTLVIVSNLGLEVSLGYLAQKYADNVDVRVLTTNELRTPQTGLEKYNRVIFCGDWDTQFCLAVRAAGVDETAVIRFEPQTSPTSRLMAVLGATELNPLMVRLLDLLDEHMTEPLRRPVIQHLSTGLSNYPTQTTHQALERLIQHPENLNDVLNLGEQTYNSQIQMVRNRVELNSRAFTMPDFPNIKCAIASASELVVLTHEALHAKYPDAAVSVVANFAFDSRGDQIRYSLRSYDGTDVQKIAQKYGGGGTPVSAGYGVPTTV